jgi:hypothetical protein
MGSHPTMSKDPKPAPIQGKVSTKATETDLWDLDSDDSVAENTQSKEPERPESLPERRKSTSNLHSKKPTERSTDVPNLTPVKAAPEPDALDAEIQKAEPSTKIPESPNADAVETPEEEDATDEAPATAPTLPSFTKTERIAVTALFAILLLAGVLTLIHFSNRVPTRSLIAEKIDFPVSGNFVEIRSASTYWRKPITSGENTEVVRRGTALIPVIRLNLHSKPCVIRVFFRNEEGIVIGDGISRDVSGEQDLVIPATAGFDDIGMHAAYRTGEKEAWSVEIHEGPSRSADRKDFRKVLDTHISTDVR